jgi:predicted enzyme related to lactoylglutathione lyase
MNSVVHFEMPYDNPERVAKFYHTAFGWETQALGDEMGNYVLATTTETDTDRMPTQPGAINGGFYPKKPDMPAQYPSIVIAVDNLTEARDRVTRAGGRLLGEPMEIPGVGTYVSFMDPEGNRVAMLEPSRRDSRRERTGTDRPGREKEPVSPRGASISPVSGKSDQQWSPKQASESAAEERDDSYGANATRPDVKKPGSTRKTSGPTPGKSGSQGRNKR